MNLIKGAPEWSRYIGDMPDRGQKVRYCLARFEEFLPKSTSAEPAKVYLAETAGERARLAAAGSPAAKTWDRE